MKNILLCLDDGGPDATFSLEPTELKHLVKSIRDAEQSIGKPQHNPENKEAENIIFRKSLFVVRDIKKDEKFTSKNIRSIRPGQGLLPKYYDDVIGKIAKKDIEKGTPLSWDLVKK